MKKKLLFALSMVLVLAFACSCGFVDGLFQQILSSPSPSPSPGHSKVMQPYAYADVAEADGMQNREFQPHLIAPEQREAAPFRYLRDSQTEYNTQNVSTAEELYTATEKGYKPVCASGSQAEILLNEAYKTLDAIIANDMSESDRVHAIYDWLSWSVEYDYEVLAIYEKNPYDSSLNNHPAFDLRGVFCKRVAVCDGTAKAFQLMCFIENIECMRIMGYAGSDRIGHAWNKTKIHTWAGDSACTDQQNCTDDSHRAWYISDATWANLGVAETGEKVDSEYLTHAYLLVRDEDVSGDHFEAVNEDDNHTSYPRTSYTDYRFFQTIAPLAGAPVPSALSLRSQVAKLAEYLLAHPVSAVELKFNFDLGKFDDGYAYLLDDALGGNAVSYWIEVTPDIFLIKLDLPAAA